MENTENTTGTALGASPEAKKERLTSPMYAIQRLSGAIKGLEESKMLQDNELAKLKSLRQELVQRYIGGDLGL